MIDGKYEMRDVVALYDSILHWKNDNVGLSNSELANISPDSCALCSIYFDKACKGCPVKEKTSNPVCISSPYAKVSLLLVLWYESEADTKPEGFEAAVQNEIEFLESLYEEAVGSVS